MANMVSDLTILEADKPSALGWIVYESVGVGWYSKAAAAKCFGFEFFLKNLKEKIKNKHKMRFEYNE